MRVAFGGTRPPDLGNRRGKPFTEPERATIYGMLDRCVPGRDQVGTGLCYGVDAMISAEAKRRGFWTVAFLPANHAQTAYLVDVDEIRADPRWDEKARDRALIEWAETFYAVALYEEARQPRSGTWYTVRRAREAGKLAREPIVLRPRDGG